MTDIRALTTIGFDADDTLWHNETFFRLTQNRFTELLADFADPDHLDARLLAAERRNIGHYGFGVKGFVLSMIETAIEVTDGRVSALLSVNYWHPAAICCNIPSICCPLPPRRLRPWQKTTV